MATNWTTSPNTRQLVIDALMIEHGMCDTMAARLADVSAEIWALACKADDKHLRILQDLTIADIAAI